jgi:hypothetical protein
MEGDAAPSAGMLALLSSPLLLTLALGTSLHVEAYSCSLFTVRGPSGTMKYCVRATYERRNV